VKTHKINHSKTERVVNFCGRDLI